MPKSKTVRLIDRNGVVHIYPRVGAIHVDHGHVALFEISGSLTWRFVLGGLFHTQTLIVGSIREGLKG